MWRTIRTGLAFARSRNRAHLKACWSEPVISAAATVIGTFAMYFREPEPVPVELHVIEIAAQLAAIAIEHEFAQQSLRTRNETLTLMSPNRHRN